MISILTNLRKKILGSDEGSSDGASGDKHVDNLIALGVLLWIVADADEKFLPKEENELKEVLRKYEKINDEDMPIVLRAIKEASLERIDMYTFTKEVSEGLNREEKIVIIENLFRVGCVDGDLDEKEHEVIRKIADLFRLDHKEFIDSKIKIKKEFGLDTAGL